jgi:uncharacterized membrane protein HdeD (DUF308 family)
MTSYQGSSTLTSSGLPTPSRWICVLLGIVMIVGGLLVLSDVTLFTVISALFIGWMAIAVGGFEIIHAFWTKGWGGFLVQVLLGILYIAFGLTLVTQPVVGAMALTYILGLVLLISGVIRMFVGISRRQQLGWIMTLSGLFGVAAGLIILTGFPASGLWVLGLLLSIDLLSHGAGWLTYAWWRPAIA